MNDVLVKKRAALQTLIDEAKAVLDEDGGMEKYNKDYKARIEGLKAEVKALMDLDDAGGLTGAKQRTHTTMPVSPDVEPEPDDEPEVKAVQRFWKIKYGNVDEHLDELVREAYGEGVNWRRVLHERDQEFKSFLRSGGVVKSACARQLWAPEDIRAMLKDGLLMSEIKATMVEGTDTLGGFAVPPQRAREILMRLPGLTAVRGGGARVVQTASNMLEWLRITGGNDQYPSSLRGAWGEESQSPSEKNYTYGLTEIPIRLYTFKVPFSQSFLEDALNVLPVFTDMVATTLAIDEDNEFVVGDGAQGPRGILPGNSPETDVSTWNSEDADEIKIETTKQLRRKIASQYRRQGMASWIFNSDTAMEIETWQDGFGRFYFDVVGDDGEQLFRFPVRETEAMPDIAASAYPIVFGDLSGYIIAERLGLSIFRFQDSNTGPNKVEFHIRRRIGGRVVEPYKFAALKVDATSN